MKRLSIILFSALVMLLMVSGPSQNCSTVLGAEPLKGSVGSAIDLAPQSPEYGGGAVHVNSDRMASRHILVQLHPRTDELNFLQKAKGQGLHRLGRVYGSGWLIMSIPEGAQPRSAAAGARMLPGVLRATPDPIVHINDTLPPRDPMYKDDTDPSTKACDPLFEDCDPWDLVDQWGLFKVGAESEPLGWEIQRGSPNVVIAVIDSGMDLDHDDLWDNIWTNPEEIPNNGTDDDENGFVDDVNGYDFAGDNPGGPYDDPASEDGNPDIPMGGEWVLDSNPYPYGWGIRFDGDPAVGDALDNNMDLVSDMGVFHGTFVAGVAGAMTDNSNDVTEEYEGMAGVCWHCKLMCLRIINAEGWAFGSDAAAAVHYAADNGADVINISWGIKIDPADSTAMDEIQILVEAIEYAVSKGVIVVAAAGNSGTADLHFPACMRSTIAVGSSNWLDQRSEFSSFAHPGEIPDNGIDDDGNGWVDDVLDVVAPGELIWSTTVLSAYDALVYMLLETEGWDPGLDMYSLADGTSFSTPLVSGYVGLILSQNPGATLSQVREVIRSNAVDILDPNGTGDSLLGYDAYSGFGRMRMVIPTLAPEENLAPLADAGEDQIVPDKAKPGEERVTLDGSRSSDPDGEIISYEWMIEGSSSPIATGETVTLKLPVGSHTITLVVTDDDYATSEDQVTIEITSKNSDPPDDGDSSAVPTAMGVYNMIWSAKNNLDLTVNIRRDSNGGGTLDPNDEPVSGATIELSLTLGEYELFQDSWLFQGLTDASGNFRVKVPKAPAGSYRAQVTALKHDIHFQDNLSSEEEYEETYRNTK
jgi:thermitase